MKIAVIRLQEKSEGTLEDCLEQLNRYAAGDSKIR